MPTSPASIDKAKLEWLLVTSTRRCWTAVSVMVLSAVSLVLLSRVGGGPLQRALGCGMAAATMASAVIWLRAQQLVLRLHRSLERPLGWPRSLLRFGS